MKTIAVCLFAFVSAASLSATTVQKVNAELVNVGSPLATGRAYVGPYTLSLNGTDFAAMCIDFQDDATIGDSYSAYETQLSNSTLSTTYHPTWSAQYEEEAYLLTLILKPDADRIDIQEAAWSITDPDYKVAGAAKAFVDLAAGNYQSPNFSSFEIVSAVNDKDSRAQEFIIESGASAATPEPSTMLLMGAGFLVAGLWRRRVRSKF